MIVQNKKLIIIFAIILTLTLILVGFVFFKSVDAEEYTYSSVDEKPDEMVSEKSFYVEVKGAVKKPGVYEASDGFIINDIIKLAGGFTKNAYTNNINLSKKVVAEMVVYVFTNSEYKKNQIYKENNECISNGSLIDNCTSKNESIISSENKADGSSNLGKININLAGLEDISKLPGLGDKKAQAIIDYRIEHGNFSSIEDIKNVSGIGDSTYEKLKGYIEI